MIFGWYSGRALTQLEYRNMCMSTARTKKTKKKETTAISKIKEKLNDNYRCAAAALNTINLMDNGRFDADHLLFLCSGFRFLFYRCFYFAAIDCATNDIFQFDCLLRAVCIYMLATTGQLNSD